MTVPPQTGYPVTFSVEYPERDLNRVSTGFRIFTVIPIAIVLAAISGYSYSWLLAIPHYIVLFFLYIGVLLAAIGAWVAIPEACSTTSKA